eukprot:5712093-Amphidinium_carterae.1
MSAEEHRSKDEILRAAKSKQAAKPATKPSLDKKEQRDHGGEDMQPPWDQWADWRTKQGLSSDPPKKQETPKKPKKQEEPDGDGDNDGNDDDGRKKKRKKSKKAKTP